jgi:hypothetical protein
MLSLKSDVNVSTVRNKQKFLEKNLFLVGILKATAEKSRIRIHESGSVSKCHGSGTLQRKFSSCENSAQNHNVLFSLFLTGSAFVWFFWIRIQNHVLGLPRYFELLSF